MAVGPGASRSEAPGVCYADLLLVPAHGFVNRPIDKGVHGLATGFGVGFDLVLFAFRHIHIYSVVVVPDILVHGLLLGFGYCHFCSLHL